MYLKKIVLLFFVLSISLYAQNTEFDNFWLWVALFALAIVTIISLFISSWKMQQMQQMHEKVLQKHLEIERKENELLTNMSENIYSVVKQVFDEQNAKQKSLEKIETFDKQSLEFPNTKKEDKEDKLLNVTNDLIDFLQLKSNKVEIVNDKFNLNNVLNEVAGSLRTAFPKKDIELIFDIDKNVPRNLIGDLIHFSQILNSILEFLMSQRKVPEVKLEISMYDTFDDDVELQFQFIDSGGGLSKETLDKLFVPYFNEKKGRYVNLSLFVSQELIGMMRGKMSVQSVVDKGTTFTLSLPFEAVDKNNKRKYRLPSKELIEKKVFIVDTSYNASLAIKKMFAYFRHEVTVLSEDEFMDSMPNFLLFDILVINEKLFNIRLNNYIKKVKKERELKVVAISSLFVQDRSPFSDNIVDTYLVKPLNQERVFEMIISLFQERVPEQLDKEVSNFIKKAHTHRGEILSKNGVDQKSFADFDGKNLLIVEDNMVNQKVLLSVLSLSGIKIFIANNGEEAVNIIKNQDIIFDLILMDINMPIMDGYSATQMIRLESKFDNLPIVAFTALVLDSEVEKMFSCGINAFLAKPLDIGKLYTVMNMYLKGENEDKKKKEKEKEKGKEEIINRLLEDVDLEGLDVKVGLEHSNNSQVLYSEILREFLSAYGDSDELFVKLVDEKRFEQLRILCVDMRGLTGTIGANEMNKLMIDILPHFIYHKHTIIGKHKEKYIFMMKRLKKSIETYLNLL